MDALAHAVESYIGTFRTEYSDAKAVEAVQGIKAYLKRAYDNGGGTRRPGRGMLLASHNAGISFTRGFVGYVHSIAHTLGSVYNMPHGLAIAITMPYVLEACGEASMAPLGGSWPSAAASRRREPGTKRPPWPSSIGSRN